MDEEGRNKFIRFFPKSSLSKDAKPRFQELFDVRKRWLDVEIAPYVEDLAPGGGKKLDALLLKYARIIKEGNKTILTNRFPRS